MTGRGFGRALFSSPGGRSPPPLSPRPAGRSEHPPFPPPPAAGPGGAGFLPLRHGLLRASLFLNASCRGNAADARRDSLPGSGPSPPRPSRLCGADQTPSARPRVPQNSGSAGSAPCPEEFFSFLVFLYRLRRQRAPLLAPRPAGRSVFPPFPRLRPCAASSCRKKRGDLMAFPRCSRSSFPPSSGTRPRPSPAARPPCVLLPCSSQDYDTLRPATLPGAGQKRRHPRFSLPHAPLPEVSPPPSPCPGHASSSVKKF